MSWSSGDSTVGFGAQKVLASHLSFRADVTFIAIVVIRPTVGISVPIGRYARAAH